MTTLRSILLSNPSQICATIQDDNSVKGTDLFRAILKHDIQNDAVKEIHLISCENPPEYYQEAVNNSKIGFYNLFQDPSNWLQKNKFENGIFDRILNSKDGSSTVMIDSINFFIHLENINYICSVIHKLKRHFKKVICLLHADETTNDEIIKMIRFLSNVYLKLNKNKSKSNVMNEKKSKLVEGIHVKPSGKIAAFKEIFFVDENSHLHSEVYHGVKENSVCSNLKENFKNITTFRLGLDIMENEKKARDDLVLPYLRSSNKGDGRTESGEGKIVYYAESGDDMEDDPDDDLDI